MTTKLSQIASGGATQGAVDKVVAVRGGTTDFLVTPVALDAAQTFSAQQSFNSIVAAGTAPSAALSTGAGTGATKTLTGNDNAGTLSITTAGTPAANANIAVITNSINFPNGCAISLTPANAAALAVVGLVYCVGATTGWTLKSGSVALTTATTYLFNYNITGF